MKASHSKCHLLVSGKNSVTMNASRLEINKSECEKLLEMSIEDWSLKTN